MWKSLFFLVFFGFFFFFWFFFVWFFWFLWFFLVPVLCSSVPLQPSPNKRAQAPADSIEFPMGSKETLARNWSFHFSQVNYISLFIFVVDRDLSRNSCLTHATTVLSEKIRPSTMPPANQIKAWGFGQSAILPSHGLPVCGCISAPQSLLTRPSLGPWNKIFQGLCFLDPLLQALLRDSLLPVARLSACPWTLVELTVPVPNFRPRNAIVFRVQGVPVPWLLSNL